jgi:hypothetical protein
MPDDNQPPIGPENGVNYEAGESNTEAQGGQHVPTVREETIADQIHNGLMGANDSGVYIQGEMQRGPILVEQPRTEIVPGAIVDTSGRTGHIPERSHSTPEDIATHHAEDVAMHDADAAKQAPIIIVD